MPDDQDKIEMLRHLWSGDGYDYGKHRSDSGKGPSKSKGTKDSKWPSIDLHKYKQLEEQLSAAQKAIEAAIVDGHNGIIIIHGKGQGILRSRLIGDIKNHPHVAELISDQDAFGKSGQVRVRFR